MKEKLSKIHIQTFWFSETFTTILGKIFAKFSLNYVIFDKIPISFPEHARSRVSGGHSSGETE